MSDWFDLSSISAQHVRWLLWVTLSLFATVIVLTTLLIRKLRQQTQKMAIWVHGHLLPAVAGSISVAAVLTLFSGIFGDLKGLDALYLAGLMLVAAGICQYSNELLGMLARIKKAGPFEFVEQRRQIIRFEEKLKKIRFSPKIQTDLKLTEKDLHVYEKASQFIAFMEFYGLEHTDIASSKDFRELLETVARIATKQGDYARAMDWAG